MTPERYQKYQQTLNLRQPDLTVLTDQVHKPHNLSAIIRTCDAVGIHEVHVTQPKEGYRDFRGRACGSQRWVQVNLYDEVTDAITQLQQQGYAIYAAHFSEQAVNFRDVDYCRPCAVLLGAEKKGVSSAAAALVDQHITIPMQGMVGSFNVSVAAAVILAEAQRQREQAGLYEQARLNQGVYQQTLFQWAYPELAEYCDQRGLAYPELDGQGVLINPSDWYAKVKDK
ncbi:tRNA (guanosine(18)-2'-O)-methyltransferase TrmH [Endozoicomonas sp. SM1973]|uniref:tRNA (guanosine(18)-2'-O)-methyltransferase n=2 Tax=Spartinivicinus marinus TaxID=2994442 RepID=A0A853IE71_9GAMM|nr:tRNA (guanosine(18)-2'-O)-methyltransferase TrmH [Spartinivicinus marinus]